MTVTHVPVCEFRLWRIRSFPVLVAVTRLTRAYRSFHIGFAGEELLAVLLLGVEISFYRVLFFFLVFPASLVVSIEIVHTV